MITCIYNVVRDLILEKAFEFIKTGYGHIPSCNYIVARALLGNVYYEKASYQPTTKVWSASSIVAVL